MNGQREKIKGSNAKAARDAAFMSILAPNAPFPYVEAYKTLRTNLDFVATASKAKCIVVTSALPEESKSTVSINLALTLDDNGKSVALVECDLRKPTLRRYLRLDRGLLGLSSILAGVVSVEECIQTVPGTRIAVITAGATPPNPSELLNQECMKKLIAELKEKYDYVILDAPPVMVVTDAAVAGRVSDGALMVIRSKYASTKTIRMAVQRLKAVDIRVLGAVVTRFSARKDRERLRYQYGDYEYGYHRNRSST